MIARYINKKRKRTPHLYYNANRGYWCVIRVGYGTGIGKNVREAWENYLDWNTKMF